MFQIKCISDSWQIRQFRRYCLGKKSGPHFAVDINIERCLKRHPMHYNEVNYVN